MKTLLVARIALAIAFSAGFGLALGQDTAAFTRPGGQQEEPRPRVRSAPAQLGLWQADERPRLGVMVEETDDGILVTDVMEDSLAASAGVQDGDILLSLGGERLDAVGDIAEILTELGPGAKVTVGVIREGEGLVKLKGKLPKAKAPKADADEPRFDGHRGAFLGVMMSDEGDADGVVVDDVVADSAAWYCGLASGDVLLGVDGKQTGDGKALIAAVGSHEPGDMVELRFRRDGKVHERMVRLGAQHKGGPLGMALPGLQGLRIPGMNSNMPRRFNVRPGNQWQEMFDGEDVDLHELHDLFSGKAGKQGNAFFFNMGDDDAHGFLGGDGGHALFFGEDGHHLSLDGDDIQAWVGKLHDHLGDGVQVEVDGQVIIDSSDDDGESHQVRIEVEDGQIKIDRDGKVQIIELNGADDHGNVRLLVPHGKGQAQVAPTPGIDAHALVITTDGQVTATSCDEAGQGPAVATIAITADDGTCQQVSVDCTDTGACCDEVSSCERDTDDQGAL